MPLGIPKELTTKIPYKTGIMTPRSGLEWGRMEMIDIEGMPVGNNYSGSCDVDHTGIIAVKFPVHDIKAARRDLESRGVDIKRVGGEIHIKTPDGANIIYYAE